jgi:hypothetical protein
MPLHYWAHGFGKLKPKTEILEAMEAQLRKLRLCLVCNAIAEAATE